MQITPYIFHIEHILGTKEKIKIVCHVERERDQGRRNYSLFDIRTIFETEEVRREEQKFNRELAQKENKYREIGHRYCTKYKGYSEELIELIFSHTIPFSRNGSFDIGPTGILRRPFQLYYLPESSFHIPKTLEPPFRSKIHLGERVRGKTLLLLERDTIERLAPNHIVAINLDQAADIYVFGRFIRLICNELVEFELPQGQISSLHKDFVRVFLDQTF